MSLKIYNSLSRQKENFEPLNANQVSMYVCGPTVYDKAHVGHAMSSLVFDIIRRYLEYRGYAVQHVMNFTDVDDKIIVRSTQLGLPAIELGERYIREYLDHLKELNILPATLYPRATQEIDQIIAMIRELVDKSYAYSSGGDVYFRVEKFSEYGKLSGRRLEDMQAGARIEVDKRKQHPMDFALWKASKPGEPAWDSPWGPGRPGWHIECSAMNLHHLGEQIDIHGGGNDLIFPHHENEIAQTESLTSKPFARYWVHNGMLQLSGEKMSKSLGNLVTVEEFLADYEADVLRIMILNSGYHSPLTFNEDVIGQARRALDRLRGALRPSTSPDGSGDPDQALDNLRFQMEKTHTGFIQAMDDDFNTAGALGQLFDLVRSINQARDSGVPEDAFTEAQGLLRELAHVFGLRLEVAQEDTAQAAPFVDLLIEIRTELRNQKQWALADLVRDRLAEMGVNLEDTKEGTSWRWQP